MGGHFLSLVSYRTLYELFPYRGVYFPPHFNIPCMSKMKGIAATPNKCCIRFEKVDSNGLVRMRNHIRREHGNYDHVDKSRTHLNEIIIGTDDPHADVKNFIGAYERFSGRELKTDKRTTKAFIQGLVTTSPNYFRTEEMGPGEYDEAKMQVWKEAVVEHLKDQFPGGMLCHVSLDLDEESPHINFTVCGIKQRESKKGVLSDWISPRSLLGMIEGRKGFEVHQDRLADSLKHLSIERGEIGSDAIHERPKDQQVRIAKEQARKQRELDGQEIGMKAVIERDLLPVFLDGHPNIETNKNTPADKARLIERAIAPVFEWVIQFAHKHGFTGNDDVVRERKPGQRFKDVLKDRQKNQQKGSQSRERDAR